MKRAWVAAPGRDGMAQAWAARLATSHGARAIVGRAPRLTSPTPQELHRPGPLLFARTPDPDGSYGPWAAEPQGISTRPRSLNSEDWYHTCMALARQKSTQKRTILWSDRFSGLTPFRAVVNNPANQNSPPAPLSWERVRPRPQGGACFGARCPPRCSF